jgi:hypothetical protein
MNNKKTTIPEVAQEPAAVYETKFAKQDTEENELELEGYTLEELAVEMDRHLSELYGVDFHKVTRLVNSGELREEDITEELLDSPEFVYNPYPGFKPGLPDDYVPDPDLVAAFGGELAWL